MSITPPPGSGPPRVAPDATLISSGYTWEIAAARYLHDGLNLADMAHILTLRHTGVLPAPVARELLAALLDVREMAANEFPYLPEHGELYNSREKYFGELLGHDAGWLNAGRTRRESVRIAFRLHVRHQLIDLLDQTAGFAAACTELAGRHATVVMPDYTYLQQAQPTTFGHYLLSFAQPALRHLDRLGAAFDWVNSSPAGVGAVNGSRLVPDRDYPATLLGFDRVITHPRDAMWQFDGIVDLIATAASLVLDVDRLAEDLEIFSSTEFNFVRIAGGFSRSSIAMPQKNNPYALSIARGAGGVMIGRITGLLALAKSPSARSDPYIFAYDEVPSALDMTLRTVRLMAGVVRTLTINRAAMTAALAEAYSQATDIAELAVALRGIDYRTAHDVVGDVIRAAASRGTPARNLTAAELDTAALARTGASWGLTDAELAGVLDPKRIIASRSQTGGAAKEPLAAMIEESERAVAGAKQCAARLRTRIDTATDKLIERVRSTIEKEIS